MEKEFNSAAFEKDAKIVSFVGIVGNIILTVFKAIAGIVANSGAMISDAVHSASDVLSTIIALIGIRVSIKEEDDHHPYGHERFESIAAIILAMILVFTGLSIGKEAFDKILGRGEMELAIPGMLALIAAIVSIVTKELMYRYTMRYASKHDSSAIKASAWDHRSDAFSSIGALIGIAGARLGYPILDPVASVIICLFIFKAAYNIFMEAIDKLVDKSCSEEEEARIREVAEGHEGVIKVDLLRTREFGNRVYVDMEIAVDAEKSLAEGHAVAEQVHDMVEEKFPKVKHIMIHVNPHIK